MQRAVRNAQRTGMSLSSITHSLTLNHHFLTSSSFLIPQRTKMQFPIITHIRFCHSSLLSFRYVLILEARQFHTTPAFRAGGGPGPVKPEYKRAIAEYTKKSRFRIILHFLPSTSLSPLGFFSPFTCVHVIVESFLISHPLTSSDPFYFLSNTEPGSLGIGRAIYNTFMKRTSVYAMAIVVGAIVLEEGHDQVINYLWDANNKGVCYYLSCMPAF